jgi:molecular chaperone GrpE
MVGMMKKRTLHRDESESPDPVPVRGGAEEDPGPDETDSDQPQDEQTGRLQELEAECARLTEERLRVEAELVNYRRRAIRDREEAETRAKEQVLAEIMSLADDLERALDAAEQQEKASPILDGVRMVHGRVRDSLATHGIEVIDPRGELFDPHEAEALMEVESDEFEPGIVVEVIEKGYRQGQKLLRPAKVTVAGAAR